MTKLRFLRFGIWQMLVAVTLVAVYLWLTTQAAMQNCEVSVIEIAGNFNEPLEPPEWNKVELAFLSPKDLTDFGAVIVLNPMPVPKDFETPERIKFRYRTRDIFWLPRQDPLQIAIKRLQIQEHDVQEIITERNWGSDDE